MTTALAKQSCKVTRRYVNGSPILARAPSVRARPSLCLRHRAQSLSAELSERPDRIYATDETWLDTLEAYTGLDTTSQSSSVQQALIKVEQVLNFPALDTYEPGVQNCSGHHIPVYVIARCSRRPALGGYTCASSGGSTAISIR